MDLVDFSEHLFATYASSISFEDVSDVFASVLAFLKTRSSCVLAPDAASSVVGLDETPTGAAPPAPPHPVLTPTQQQHLQNLIPPLERIMSMIPTDRISDVVVDQLRELVVPLLHPVVAQAAVAADVLLNTDSPADATFHCYCVQGGMLAMHLLRTLHNVEHIDRVDIARFMIGNLDTLAYLTAEQAAFIVAVQRLDLLLLHLAYSTGMPARKLELWLAARCDLLFAEHVEPLFWTTAVRIATMPAGFLPGAQDTHSEDANALRFSALERMRTCFGRHSGPHFCLRFLDRAAETTRDLSPAEHTMVLEAVAYVARVFAGRMSDDAPGDVLEPVMQYLSSLNHPVVRYTATLACGRLISNRLPHATVLQSAAFCIRGAFLNARLYPAAVLALRHHLECCVEAFANQEHLLSHFYRAMFRNLVRQHPVHQPVADLDELASAMKVLATEQNMLPLLSRIVDDVELCVREEVALFREITAEHPFESSAFEMAPSTSYALCAMFPDSVASRADMLAHVQAAPSFADVFETPNAAAADGHCVSVAEAVCLALEQVPSDEFGFTSATRGRRSVQVSVCARPEHPGSFLFVLVNENDSDDDAHAEAYLRLRQVRVLTRIRFLLRFLSGLAVGVVLLDIDEVLSRLLSTASDAAHATGGDPSVCESVSRFIARVTGDMPRPLLHRHAPTLVQQGAALLERLDHPAFFYCIAKVIRKLNERSDWRSHTQLPVSLEGLMHSLMAAAQTQFVAVAHALAPTWRKDRDALRKRSEWVDDLLTLAIELIQADRSLAVNSDVLVSVCSAAIVHLDRSAVRSALDMIPVLMHAGLPPGSGFRACMGSVLQDLLRGDVQHLLPQHGKDFAVVLVLLMRGFVEEDFVDTIAAVPLLLSDFADHPLAPTLVALQQLTMPVPDMQLLADTMLPVMYLTQRRILRSHINHALLLGTHPRVGSDSSVHRATTNYIWDANVLGIIDELCWSHDVRRFAKLAQEHLT